MHDLRKVQGYLVYVCATGNMGRVVGKRRKACKSLGADRVSTGWGEKEKEMPDMRWQIAAIPYPCCQRATLRRKPPSAALGSHTSHQSSWNHEKFLGTHKKQYNIHGRGTRHSRLSKLCTRPKSGIGNSSFHRQPSSTTSPRGS